MTLNSSSRNVHALVEQPLMIFGNNAPGPRTELIPSSWTDTLKIQPLLRADVFLPVLKLPGPPSLPAPATLPDPWP